METQILRYWGRKPIEIIQEIMKEINDIVIDPFGGSGSIILSALEKGNRAVYIDINPYAWLTAYVNIIGTNVKEYKEKVYEVLNNLIPVNKKELENDYLYYPNGKPFLKKEKIDRITQLFTEENFKKLYSILKTIDNIEASINTKLALYGTFCHILFKSSKMKRKNAGDWGIPSYWVPKEYEPHDPIEEFEISAKHFAEYFRKTKRYELHKDVKLYLGDALEFEYNEGVLFTDPPFYNEIQYSELSFFYLAWLKESKFPEILKKITGKDFTLNFRNEIIVNENKGIDYEKYLELMSKFLIKTSKMKKKYIIFHYDNQILKNRFVNLVKKFWGNIEIKEFDINNQRKIGYRGSSRYVLIKN